MTEDVKLQGGRGQTVVLLSNCMLRYRRKEIYRSGKPLFIYTKTSVQSNRKEKLVETSLTLKKESFRSVDGVIDGVSHI